jgi:hypothetical protein
MPGESYGFSSSNVDQDKAMSPFVQYCGGGRNSKCLGKYNYNIADEIDKTVKKISGVTGPLEINHPMRLLTELEDEVKDEAKIVEAAKDKIMRFEERLIHKYRHGRGDSGPPVIPGIVLDKETATANLKQKARELEEKWQSLEPTREEQHMKYELKWEMVINELWHSVLDSLTVSRKTGEPFWPELSAPEARGTRRADSDTPPLSRRWSSTSLHYV